MGKPVADIEKAIGAAPAVGSKAQSIASVEAQIGAAPAYEDSKITYVGVKTPNGPIQYVPAGEAALMQTRGIATIVSEEEQRKADEAMRKVAEDDARQIAIGEAGRAWEAARTYATEVQDEFTFGLSSKVRQELARLKGGEEGVKAWQQQRKEDLDRHSNLATIAHGVGLVSNFVATAGLGEVVAGSKAARAAAMAEEAARAAEGAGLARGLTAAERAGLVVDRAEAAQKAVEAIREAKAESSLGRLAANATEAEKAVTRSILMEEAAGAGAAKAEPVLTNMALDAAKAVEAGGYGNKARYAWSAAEGLGQGLHKHISDDAFGERKFNFEDAAVSGLIGSAIGVGGRFAGEFIGAKLASGAISAGTKAEERVAVKTLKNLGFDKKDLRKVLDDHGTYTKYVQTIEKDLGVKLIDVERGELGKSIEGLQEKIGEARNRVIGLADDITKKVDGGAPDLAGVLRRIEEVENAEIQMFKLEGPERVANFAKWKERFQNVFKDESWLKGMDKVQSEIGYEIRALDTPYLPSFNKMEANFLRKIQGVVKDEIDNTIARTGDPELLTAWKSVNKSYSYWSMLDKYVATDLNKAASHAAQDTGHKTTFGKFMQEVLPHAAGYAAVSGNPMALVYPLAFATVRSAVGKSVKALDSGISGVTQRITSSQAAMSAFERAIDSRVSSAITRAGTSYPGEKKKNTPPTVSKDLQRFTNRKEFDKLVQGILSGESMASFTSSMGDEHSHIKESAMAFNNKLSTNIKSMLPQQSPYLVGPGTSSAFNWKMPDLIDPDGMKILRYLDAVLDPISVADKVIAGVAGPEHIKAVADMYPDIDRKMRDGLMGYLMNPNRSIDKIAISPEVRASLSKYLGMSVDMTNSPEFARTMSDIRAQQAKTEEEAASGAEKSQGGAQAPNHANYAVESERIEK